MKNLKAKLITMLVTALAMSCMTGNSLAQERNYFEVRINEMIADYTKAVREQEKTEKTQEDVIQQCTDELESIGFQLSSLLVTPTGSSGGANARSWTPDDYLEVCTHVPVDGNDTVLMCIRVRK